MKKSENYTPKALICAIIILFLSVLGAWLYALSGGFQEIIYVLGGITIAFWVCLYILVYKFSQNKMFSYIIWFYFISSALIGICMFFDVDVPRIFGICFLIFFGSVWAPITYLPEYILRLISENSVLKTDLSIMKITFGVIIGMFVIVFFFSIYSNCKQKNGDKEPSKKETDSEEKSKDY